jgi:hypothetical protein
MSLEHVFGYTAAKSVHPIGAVSFFTVADGLYQRQPAPAHYYVPETAFFPFID